MTCFFFAGLRLPNYARKWTCPYHIRKAPLNELRPTQRLRTPYVVGSLKPCHNRCEILANSNVVWLIRNSGSTGQPPTVAHMAWQMRGHRLRSSHEQLSEQLCVQPPREKAPCLLEVVLRLRSVFLGSKTRPCVLLKSEPLTRPRKAHEVSSSLGDS